MNAVRTGLPDFARRQADPPKVLSLCVAPYIRTLLTRRVVHRLVTAQRYCIPHTQYTLHTNVLRQIARHPPIRSAPPPPRLGRTETPHSDARSS